MDSTGQIANRSEQPSAFSGVEASAWAGTRAFCLVDALAGIGLSGAGGAVALADCPWPTCLLSGFSGADRTHPGESGAQLLQQLVLVRLLKKDGEDFVCPRFAMLHSEMGQRSQAQRGGDMRAFKLRMKKAGGQSFQQALLIPDTKLVDAEGQPLAAEEVKRVTRLIGAVIRALQRAAPVLRLHRGTNSGCVAHSEKVHG